MARCHIFGCASRATQWWICKHTSASASYHCDGHAPSASHVLSCCRVYRLVVPVVGDEMSIALECAFRILAGDTRRAA